MSKNASKNARRRAKAKAEKKVQAEERRQRRQLLNSKATIPEKKFWGAANWAKGADLSLSSFLLSYKEAATAEKVDEPKAKVKPYAIPGPGLYRAMAKASEDEVRSFLMQLPPECVDRIRAAFESHTLSDRTKSKDEFDSSGMKPVWGIQANKPMIVGYAPLAVRPRWLPEKGKGQANVHPLCWSISIEKWIFFLRACISTHTWKRLVELKGEYGITMYDVNDHFVKPWTSGTGCSLAILMQGDEELPAEGMLSHSWGGSVVETYNCLQNMVNKSDVPSVARFFFCTFSMYQPEDGAQGGLSISEQIKLEPFAKIIESRPKYGMFVLHTTVSEVYDRLWVVHEADVAVTANVLIRGLFDMYTWTTEQFRVAASVKTIEGKCGVENDRAYIDGLILARGGYERLDCVIKKLRTRMLEDLGILLNCNDTKTSGSSMGSSSGSMSHCESTAYFDWNSFHLSDYGCPGGDNGFSRTQREWKYHRAWCESMERVREAFDGPVDILSPYHQVGYNPDNWEHGWCSREECFYEGACPLGSKAGGIQYYSQVWRE